MNDKLMSRLEVKIQWLDGLGALINARATNWEPKDSEGTRYDREELKESTTSATSSYYLF